jgi:hypothetical protein
VNRTPSTRKLFYSSITLLIVALLLLVAAALWHQAFLALLGLLAFLGAAVVQLSWIFRTVR